MSANKTNWLIILAPLVERQKVGEYFIKAYLSKIWGNLRAKVVK